MSMRGPHHFFNPRPHEIVTDQRRAHVLQQRRQQDFKRADLEEYLDRVRSVDSAIGLQRRYGRGHVDHIESDFERAQREAEAEAALHRQIQHRAAASARRMRRAEEEEEVDAAAVAKRKMLQRLIEQDPELRRLRLHLDRAYQRRDNDASADIRAQRAAAAEEEERRLEEARQAVRRTQEEEERRLHLLAQERIAQSRRGNWSLHEQRQYRAQQEYRDNVHRERLVNAFVDDQLQEEDEAARRFAEENRRVVLAELQAQEHHHARQKKLLAEQERVAAEQDEWYRRVVERRRQTEAEKRQHRDEAHERFIQLFAQEVRRRRQRDEELAWAKEVLEQDALEREWAARDAEKHALAQLIRDDMVAGNEALKRQRAAIVRDLKHRERLMVEEMAARAREAALAAVAERERRLANKERFIRGVEEQRQYKEQQKQLALDRRIAEQRAARAADEAYRDSVAAARRFLIEEHAPVLREYFPKAAFTTMEMLDALKDNVIFDDDGVRETPAHVLAERRGEYDPRERKDLHTGLTYRT